VTCSLHEWMALGGKTEEVYSVSWLLLPSDFDLGNFTQQLKTIMILGRISSKAGSRLRRILLRFALY
jgi:hypothetical protein